MNVAIVGATGYGGIQLVNLLRRNRNYKLHNKAIAIVINNFNTI